MQTYTSSRRAAGLFAAPLFIFATLLHGAVSSATVPAAGGGPGVSSDIAAGAPAAISAQPLSQTAPVGSTVTLSVTATGTPAPTYQWQKNGAPITGAVNASLVLANLQPGDSAAYTAAVTNPSGTVISIPAIVNALPAPVRTVISGWDFQNLAVATNLTPASDLGAVAGAAATVGMNNMYGTPGPSTDISDIAVSAGSSDTAATNNAWRVRGGPNPTQAANGWSSLAPIGTQGAQFLVNTTGYSGIQLRFDVNTTTQAEANLQLQYTLDGSTWTNFPIAYTGAAGTINVNSTSANTVQGTYIQFTTGAWYNGITADFSGILGAANNPNFGVRLVNASTGADDLNGSGTAYNNSSGNWRLDEVQVLGVPATPFAAGNLVVSRSVYSDVGAVAALQPGQNLPDSPSGTTPFVAVANGSYPNVFNNTTVDANFGVTAPIYLDQVTTSGNLVGTLAVPASVVSTSFPSKSEVALNLSADGQSLTFMGYVAPFGAMDISNSNTPAIIEPGNFVTAPPTYRAVVQVSLDNSFQVTTTNAYAGNNGRAAVAANGLYYTVGNAGAGNGSAQVTAATGVQIIVPGQDATASAPGTQNGGAFNITQLGDTADKPAKDNNFRGATIFNNTLYVSKGSGNNGINTVYQVGTAGTLPTLANAATTPITVLPGFPTVLAKSTTGVSHPFGLWFANANTLYVADEGDGILADLTNGTDPASGLQKWVLAGGTWQLAYTLQNGLNLGANYSVSDGAGDSYLPTATDGLRNLTGKVNGDGTVTVYAVTSTVSASGDQGADPNELVALTDTLALTNATQAAAESFTVLRSAGYGEVLRGVSFAPATATPAAAAIVSQPQSASALTGGTVTFSVGTTGVPAPTFQWVKDANPIAGATGASLVLSDLQLTDAGNYTVVVTNASGSVTSNAATLTVNAAVAPAITTAPVAQTVTVGGSATFSAAASGAPAPTFQWQKSGTPITGATGSSFALTNVQLADAGNYTVVATNSAGSITSAAVALTVNPAAGGTPVVISGWDFQNLAVATNLAPASDLGAVAGAAATVGMNNTYGTPGPSTDISDIAVSAGSSDTAAINNAWRVRGGPNPTQAANGWSSLAPIGTQGAQFLVNTTGYSGIQLRFDVNTTTQAEANLQLQYTLDGSTWTNLPIAYSGTGATVKVNSTSANTVQGTYLQFTTGAWYNDITADLSGIPGAANNPNFGVRLVNAATGADDINGSGTAYNNNSGNWRFDEVQVLGVQAATPAITAAPTAQTTSVGGTVTLSVTATGNPAPSYQWQKNGAPITGATNSTLVLTNVQTADAGSYTVVVTNGSGSVTSVPAIVSVAVSAGGGSVVISGWDFQNLSVATNLAPASDLGAVAGLASALGMNNTYGTPGPSTDISDIAVAAGSSDTAATNNAWRVRGGPNPTQAANGWSSLAPIGTQGAQFLVNTTGYSGVKVRFDVDTTAQAEANLQLQYTLDGGIWTNIPVAYSGTGATVKVNSSSANTVQGAYIQFSAGAWFNGIAADFSAIPGANNNPNFGVRLVNASTGADNLNGSGAAYNNSSGNWRFDEVQVTGVPVVLFAPGNLVVSRSVYSDVGAVGALQPGQNLPDSPSGTTPFVAVANGSYPNVFNNTTVDANFGVTSPIYLDQVTTSGNLVGTLAVPASVVSTSFPSKSEVALNLSADGQSLTFMGYVAPFGAMDISNSNTPAIIEPGNFVTAAPTYRAVVQVGIDNSFQVTTTNAYAGNNGRAVVVGNGLYYTVGNAGAGNGSPQVTAATGVQIVVPGQNATSTTPGTQNVGSFSITQVGDTADKTAKDNNFRGATIFNNTLYVSKGSGSNGINTVYQVGAAGALPTLANASTTPIAILPGFPTTLAKNTTGVSHPFGLWFANASTLYVADEGDGILADLTNGTDPTSGLQKWVLVGGTWQLAYTVQNGLSLGTNYTVSDNLGNSYLPTATDGLRNLTGKVNGDGTVTIYAITSTVSASGDEGADPNKLVALTDTLAFANATQAASETFATLRSARYGEVLRGVAFAPAGAAPVAPAIASQPQGATATVGDTVTLSVGATGIPAPSYQWKQGSTVIAGATNSSLVLNNVQLADAGSYTVVVTNGSGSVTSAVATLTVIAPTAPFVTTAPAPQTVTVGGSATFSVAATGIPTPAYQWQKNGNTIAGAVNSTLTLTNVQLADAGSYTVVITNSAGSITSAAAVLTVNAPAPGSGVIISGWDFQNLAVTTNLTPAPDLGAGSGSASTLGMTNTYPTPGPSTDISDITVAAGSSDPAASNNAWRVRGGPIPTQAANGWSSLAPIGTQGAQFLVDTTGYTGIQVKFDVDTTAQAEANLELLYTLDGSTWINAPITYSGAGATIKVNTTSANTVQGSYIQFTGGAWFTGITADFSAIAGAGNNPHFGVRLVNASTGADDLNGSGTPYNNSSGNWRFDEVQVIGVPPPAPVYHGGASVNGTSGTAFNFTPAFTGAITGYSLVASTLPTGLGLNPATGAITGMPTQTGTFAVTVQATGPGGSTNAQISLIVNPAATAPVVAGTSAVTATVGTAFSSAVTLGSGTATGYAATGLPPGLAIDPTTGLISGTPTTAGTYPAQITASNAAGTGPAHVLVLQINPSATSSVITSAPVAPGTAGGTFNYTVTASNSPISFVVTSGTLPAGLSLNPTSGAITGTPTQSGQSMVWIAATNASGQGISLGLLFNIAISAATPVITGNTTAAGQVGQNFQYQITATNSPMSFALASGTPPAGLTLDPVAGTITGVPAAATTTAASITLTATNTSGTSAALVLLISIAPAPATPVITSAGTAAGQVGTAFSYQAAATAIPTGFSAQNLPAGLVIGSSTGLISGTPTAAGIYAVTIQASNPAGSGPAANLTLVVAPSLLTPAITSAASVAGTVGQSLTYSVAAAPGPVTGYALMGTLPLGATFNTTTGVISGVPAEPGISTVTLTATNSAGTSLPQTVVFAIAPAAGVPAITSATNASGAVGVSFNFTITATNVAGSTPFPPAVTLDAVNLPPGLGVNPSTGVISGLPTAAGTYAVSIVGTNAAGTGAAGTLTITINPAPSAPTVTSVPLAAAQVGVPFTYQMTAGGGPTSFTALNAPAWMTVNSLTGALSGTPAAPGPVTVQMAAANASGSGPSVALTISVAPAANTPVVTSGRAASGQLSSSFSYQITAAPAPTSYLATGLPAGLAIDPVAGIISGVPLASGAFPVIVSATNVNGQGAPVTVVLTIASSLQLSGTH